MTYSIVRRSDARFAPFGEFSAYKLKFGKFNPGPPFRIELIAEAGVRRLARPAAMYDLNNIFPRPDIFETIPTILANDGLLKSLKSLAPETFDSFSVTLEVDNGPTFTYYAIVPHAVLKGRNQIKPNDFEWGGFAFSPSEAPGRLFTLETATGKLLIVDAVLASEIEGRSFFDTVVSPFRRV